MLCDSACSSTFFNFFFQIVIMDVISKVMGCVFLFMCLYLFWLWFCFGSCVKRSKYFLFILLWREHYYFILTFIERYWKFVLHCVVIWYNALSHIQNYIKLVPCLSSASALVVSPPVMCESRVQILVKACMTTYRRFF